MNTKAESHPHPAPFMPAMIDRAHLELVAEMERTGVKHLTVLDPFAGIGGVHALSEVDYPKNGTVRTFGIELEPEWAKAHVATRVGNALHIDKYEWCRDFDAVVSSPCYGNRMADSHDAKDDSQRITYRHRLGRPLTEGSAGAMQWGHQYRVFHEQVIRLLVVHALKPGALVMWNVKNHVRNGRVQKVVEWHLNTWLMQGCTIEWVWPCQTKGMGFGANADARVPNEMMLCLRTPQLKGLL